MFEISFSCSKAMRLGALPSLPSTITSALASSACNRPSWLRRETAVAPQGPTVVRAVTRQSVIGITRMSPRRRKVK